MSNIDFTPGAIVGRYEIIERIGAGGMAEVFLGKDRRNGERVAIKRMLPSFANDQRFIDMFIAEARLAATLHHPNIAKVHEVGVDHGACYFAMEYVAGPDVRALLAAATARGRPMPLPIALSIMYGTTCALAYVHDPNGPHAKLNIVHRDISPSNILVSFTGAIKLVDFGIARVETGALTPTGSGQLKGKIPYMSPEQCRARPLDGRSDLFSLGVTLYELTTNIRPFDRGSEFATLEAIVTGELKRPSRVVPSYPRDLEPIVMRLLATRPTDRYPSAGALLVDLDHVIATHKVDVSDAPRAAHIAELLGRAKPTPRVERGPTTVARRPIAQVAIKRPPPERLNTEPVMMAVEPPSDVLSANARLPIERVALLCDQLLRTVAPEITDARDLSCESIAQLVGRAMRWHAKGDLENAVIASSSRCPRREPTKASTSSSHPTRGCSCRCSTR